MLSRLQLRVRNRRLGSRHYALFAGINSSAFSQTILGCAIVLLIVEMMSSQPHHGLLFDQYASRNAVAMPAALRDDALRVMLTRDGTIYFGNVKTRSKDLPQQIRKRMQNTAQRKVFLVVDKRAKYWDVSTILDDVREAGIGDIAFLTERPFIHK